MPLALPPGIFTLSFRRPALLREIWSGAIGVGLEPAELHPAARNGTCARCRIASPP
ncbi:MULTISPECIES: hypothetical protein [Ralstonia solanacearum species complex]|uniref:hypothetical protein n=1 Tax=Ralstonia solanacearum species complex TaxID=3116862 RepID=UPI0002DAD810|nr:hypothetical protein [Ralstonia solanacearum]MDC6179861.1 hypothetical protein [Ralstonia solanacearum]MDC6212424.1 hypothetical protein [Ralstonia solanacearum]MDC6242017.1 hypothetical protein [Ralstonia solanacearum]MDD7803123.1 hypothetical protein [Ralstonia solanacearum]MDN4062061.1 hypothetical protein [Ralstonia solanacearum]